MVWNQARLKTGKTEDWYGNQVGVTWESDLFGRELGESAIE